MIRVGDKVKFLNDVGGGTVTGFINKKTVNVMDEDGFEVPYPIAQLVNVSMPEESAQPVESKEIANNELVAAADLPVVTEGNEIAGKDNPDFYFCFVPRAGSKDHLSKGLDLFLVNDSNYRLFYIYYHLVGNRAKAVGDGTIFPNSKAELESFAQHELGDLPEFGFQIIYFSGTIDEWNRPVEKTFRINPVKLYKESTFQTNSFFPVKPTISRFPLNQHRKNHTCTRHKSLLPRLVLMINQRKKRLRKRKQDLKWWLTYTFMNCLIIQKA